MTDTLFHLKYPIGKYKAPEEITPEHIENWIKQIGSLPDRLNNLVQNISEEQLDTSYRPGGWTIRQVIHHIPDSHVNSYIRFKWALTENNPTIKAYHEDRWAELEDTVGKPIQDSLDFLKIVHVKLVNVFKNLSEEQLKRTFVHPESGREIRLDWNIGMYAWHGEHHLGHIHSVVDSGLSGS